MNCTAHARISKVNPCCKADDVIKRLRTHDIDRPAYSITTGAGRSWIIQTTTLAIRRLARYGYYVKVGRSACLSRQPQDLVYSLPLSGRPLSRHSLVHYCVEVSSRRRPTCFMHCDSHLSQTYPRHTCISSVSSAPVFSADNTPLSPSPSTSYHTPFERSLTTFPEQSAGNSPDQGHHRTGRQVSRRGGHTTASLSLSLSLITIEPSQRNQQSPLAIRPTDTEKVVR